MLASYFDESGTHDDSIAVAFAGYTSTPEIWIDFEQQWLEHLKTYGLRYFHMAEFVARAAPFDQLTDDERLALITSLIACISGHDLAGTAVVLKRDDFSLVMPGIQGRANDPYYMLMMRLMGDVLLFAAVRRERVLFTFDRRQKVAQLAGMLHDAVLQAHPWLRGILSDKPVFGSKLEHVPLQAADVLAYEAYRRSCDFSRPERKSYSALGPTFGELIVMSAGELAFYSLDPRIRSAVADIMKS